MKRGFTLLELIIVVMIIGVLATLGFATYGRLIEGARGAEARDIIGAMRKMAIAYYIKNGNTLAGLLDADVGIGTPGIPNACAGTHFFSYTYIPRPVPAGTVALTFQASRCGPGPGKDPDAAAAVANAVTLATNLATGVDTWTNVSPY
jgi:prepilin-type N-terminal cleavage/methylation domain-containing protein